MLWDFLSRLKYLELKNKNLKPCISVVPEARHKARLRPLKGAVSTQKALRGSETEMRELLGGTEENSVSPMRGH